MKLILDTHCEIYDLIKSWADDEFWDLSSHSIQSGAVYVIGRQQFLENLDRLKAEMDRGESVFIFSNPHEGSDTLRWHLVRDGLDKYAHSGKMLIIGGGDMDESWPCLQYDSFLPKVLDYDENYTAIERTDEIFDRKNKPYRFLFLNGRVRPHRKQMIENLMPHLDTALWSNLDECNGPLHRLPTEYEFDFYKDRVDLPTEGQYIKHQLFNNDWGEIYLNPDPYIDTYFSIVSETVFDYPYSFRTEKIWKPVVMGHPWIAVANQGFYRDIHALGFKTFDGIVDESFDNESDNNKRLQMITDEIVKLLNSDLNSFVEQCKDVCKYNQQHYKQMRNTVRAQFPDQFFTFLRQYT